MTNQINSIESVVMQHSARGMNVLREHMSQFYVKDAVEKLLALPKGTVLLTTGFYVAGHAETDGPAGTATVATALKKIGYQPVIITDKLCRGFFEVKQIPVCYVAFDADQQVFRDILKKYQPVACISIERCGINSKDEYANMRSVSITAHTARIDLLFTCANQEGIYTIGVGDGGNEIGMGNLKHIIEDKLSLVPCVVETSSLIIATVSNWGAYAMVSYMQRLTGIHVLPSFQEIKQYLDQIVRLGSVDGVKKENISTVDGFPIETSKEIIDSLHQFA